MAKKNSETESTANGTPATTTEKGPSIIEQLHKEWVANGSKEPTAAATKEAVKAYLAAKKAKEAAKVAYEKAQKAESDTVVNIIKLHGKGKLKIAGEVLLPMTRGTTVFLRGEGTSEVKDLGG